MKILRLLQRRWFSAEVAVLQKKQRLPGSSRLIGLVPFLDNAGLLRVGGRLQHANLKEDANHSILLSQQHALTKAIIREIHLQPLHGGAQLTLSILHQKYRDHTK